MKRINILLEAKIIHVTVSVLLFFSGIFLVSWPKDVTIVALRWLVGGNFVIIGAARALGYFANDLYRLAFQYDLAVGGLSAILGVLIFLYPENVLSVITYVVGVYILLDGLLKLQTAFDAKAFGMRKWIGLLLSSSLLSIGGVIILIGSVIWAEPMILVGVALIGDGAENVWNTMGTVRVRAKKEERFGDLL